MINFSTEILKIFYKKYLRVNLQWAYDEKNFIQFEVWVENFFDRYLQLNNPIQWNINFQLREKKWTFSTTNGLANRNGSTGPSNGDIREE